MPRIAHTSMARIKLGIRELLPSCTMKLENLRPRPVRENTATTIPAVEQAATTEQRDFPAATAPFTTPFRVIRSLESKTPVTRIAAVAKIAAFMGVVFNPSIINSSTPTGINSFIPLARDSFKLGTSSSLSPARLCFTASRSTILTRQI